MKLSIRESRLVSVGVASAIAVGVIGFGNAVLAQEGSGDSATPTPTTDDGTTTQDCVGKGLRVLGVLRHLGENLGLTAEEIQQGRDAGLTWGQIIDQYGSMSAAEAKAQALAKLQEELAEKVAEGKITQEEADQRLADAGAKIDEWLNKTPAEAPLAPGRGGKGLPGIGRLGEDLGLTRDEVQEGAAAGLTWGQIIDQYGDVSAAEAKAQALAKLQERLNEAVANGRLTQEEADQKLADAGAKLDAWLNSKPGNLTGHPGRGRGMGSAMPLTPSFSIQVQ
ncbi:hypothetical protein [Tepidiforma sp.]|uniref:hypothetical protein n=1 Tax=Tepidiforma sp. TaxID=2682230 RepID=UPI002ADE69BE|nr:hypothetical protein [Tepidiforma sp.]